METLSVGTSELRHLHLKRMVVLRLGHRRERDKRVTTHCALVARAFGAEGMYYSGEDDPSLETSLDKVVTSWGGRFFVSHIRSPTALISKWRSEGGLVVHLTMYGLNLPERLEDLKSGVADHDALIIIGGSKVPIGIYRVVDFNVAIGNQPHSEVAALAILLDRLLDGRELSLGFSGGKLKVEPQKAGKKVSNVS